MDLYSAVERISEFPSWRQGIASSTLIKKAQDAFEKCFERMIAKAMHKVHERKRVVINLLLYHIDVSKVRLGTKHYNVYVKPLVKYGYEEYFPKLDGSLADNEIYFPKECFQLREFGWWRAYFTDEPDFVREMAADILKLQKKKLKNSKLADTADP